MPSKTSSLTKDCITIQDLEVYAHHGVYDEEKKLGQKFLISAKLFYDFYQVANTDDISLGVNYSQVCHYVTEFMKEHPVNLLETLAYQIKEGILERFPLIEYLTLEVKKPWAPIGLPLDYAGVQVSGGWSIAYLGLGSNLEDRKDHLEGAIQALEVDTKCQVLAVADFLETKPYGVVEQPDFLNTCVKVKTLYSPFRLLEFTQSIEEAHHRTREVHWGPRTLDIDILFFEDEVVETTELTIPHREIPKREFVLKPLSQIAPYLRHPIYDQTVEQMLADLI